jgi:hypothetical protein
MRGVIGSEVSKGRRGSAAVLGINYRVRILVAIIKIRVVRMVLAQLRLCLQTRQPVGGGEERQMANWLRAMGMRADLTTADIPCFWLLVYCPSALC